MEMKVFMEILRTKLQCHMIDEIRQIGDSRIDVIMIDDTGFHITVEEVKLFYRQKPNEGKSHFFI